MLFERQPLVENDTTAVNRRGERNIDLLIDLHRRRERRIVVKLLGVMSISSILSSLSCSLLWIIHGLRSVMQSCIVEIS